MSGIFLPATTSVGARLAREGDLRFNIFVDGYNAFAGKPRSYKGWGFQR